MRNYKDFTMMVAESIKHCRTQAGLTQDEVGEKLQIGTEAISRIERGVTIPTMTRLAELADIFHCTLEDLIGHSSTRAQDQAGYIATLLTSLPQADRQMVLEVVQKVCERLKDRL